MPRDLLPCLCAHGVIQSGSCHCSIRSVLLASLRKLDNETLATDHSCSSPCFSLIAVACLLNFDQSLGTKAPRSAHTEGNQESTMQISYCAALSTRWRLIRLSIPRILLPCLRPSFPLCVRNTLSGRCAKGPVFGCAAFAIGTCKQSSGLSQKSDFIIESNEYLFGVHLRPSITVCCAYHMGIWVGVYAASQWNSGVNGGIHRSWMTTLPNGLNSRL